MNLLSSVELRFLLLKHADMVELKEEARLKLILISTEFE